MNPDNQAQIQESAQATALACADTRYTFTGQFLEASTIFVRRLRAIEQLTTWDEPTKTEHRGLVCAVVMQAAAALETESHEIAVHGPGSYIGSGGVNDTARQFLAPIADIIDGQATLDRFAFMFHLLGKPPMDKGTDPWPSAALVVRLRNEIVHYKSRWGAEMQKAKFYASLEGLRHKAPPFAHPSMNFFPHKCLSADCAAWAVRSVVAFLDHVYAALGVPSRFDSYRERIMP